MQKTQRPERKAPSVVGQERLPCRGCTRECRNINRCEGKPWRTVPSYQGS